MYLPSDAFLEARYKNYYSVVCVCVCVCVCNVYELSYNKIS
jgi:hypothetical protein